MWLLTNRYLLAALMTLMLVFLLTGCESDADRIRQTNEAERVRTQVPPSTFTPIPTPTTLSAEIATVEIQDGDCIISTIEEGVTIETVVIVPCSGSWQYRVLGSFTVSGFDRYPGEDSFIQLAYEQCDRRYTEFLYPLFESWTLGGDRTVNCLQHSFGLSTSDLAQLDRLVSARLLNVGECFNEAPETDGLSVEIVDCSGPWQYRVLNSFTVTGFDRYPGEDSFSRLAYEQCDNRYVEVLYPLFESWTLGDKTVTCLQRSFGLSTSDPAKLDRLVDLSSLRTGECFNEAPETDGMLVELVDCSGDWEHQIANVFTVSRDGSFPGETYFQNQVEEHCRTPWDYYYPPSPESWQIGDRDVICVKIS